MQAMQNPLDTRPTARPDQPAFDRARYATLFIPPAEKVNMHFAPRNLVRRNPVNPPRGCLTDGYMVRVNPNPCNCKVRQNPAQKSAIVRYPWHGAKSQIFKTAIMFHFSDFAAQDPAWVQFAASEITGATVNRDPYRQIMSINSWLEENVAYVMEKGERIQDPRVTTQKIRLGDCDDFVGAAIAAAESVGHMGRAVFIKPKAVTRNGRTVEQPWHVYAELGYYDGFEFQWIPIDPSMPEELKGYNVKDHAQKVVVDRDVAASLGIPEKHLYAIVAGEDTVIEVTGGELAAAGIRYTTPADLALLDDASFGRFGRWLKKVGKKIKKVAKKVGGVIKKIVKSPAFQAAAKAGAAAAGVPPQAIDAGFAIANAALSGNSKQALDITQKMVSEKLKDPNVPPAIKAKMAAFQKFATVGRQVYNKVDAVAQGRPGALQSLVQQGGVSLAKAVGSPQVAQQVSRALRQATQSQFGPLLKRIDQVVPAIRDRDIAQMVQDPGTLKALSQLGASNLARIVPDQNVRNMLQAAVMTATGADRRSTAAKAEAVFEAIAKGRQAVPEKYKKQFDKAVDVDNLLASAATGLGEAFLRLQRTRDVSQRYDTDLANYLQLKSQLIEQVGVRDNLIETVARKLGKEPPERTVITGLGESVKELLLTNHLSDMASLLFSVGTNPAEVELMAMKIEKLHADTNRLISLMNKKL